MIKTSNIVAIIDSREKKRLKLEYKPGETLNWEVGTLYTGDYSIQGLERLVCIERKSADDLLGSITKHRERFEKELQRMKGYETRCIVVESTWSDIEKGNYYSKMHPNSVLGTLMGFIAMGIPVIMAGSHKKAGIFVARMLYITARRRYLELEHLQGKH